MTSISFILLTCVLTPIYLAFPEIETPKLVILDQLMNLFFLCDIFINFISAYYDSDYQIVDHPNVRQLNIIL